MESADSASAPSRSSEKWRSAAGSSELPEKYEVLRQFFDNLDSSIRLLKLRGLVSTFTNICPKMERLTDRRFTHKHLSQLKSILPEAIEIKKVLMFDEQTGCMKPNLSVILNADAVQKYGNTSLDNGKISLRKLFCARLSEFVNAHPEGDEVPEAPLPEPFNHTQDRISNEILRSNASLPAEASRVELQPAVASHFSGSFRRRFSQKVVSNKPGDTSQIRDSEKKAMEDKDPAISRVKRRREILAALPQLFNMIHFLFKSTKRSVITREELIYRIIISRLDINDRREVEDQLDLMKELIPEWIAEKQDSTGDRLFSINKLSDPDSIRNRLAETK